MNVIAKKFTPTRPGARRTGQDNIAAALGVTERTVRRDWDKARTLLFAALK